MNDTRKIKGLQSQLTKLNEERELLKLKLNEISKQLTVKNQSISRIISEINKHKGDGKVNVSEHAILRYLERVEGISVEEIESKILTPEIIKMIEVVGGTGKYPLNGNTIVMKDFTVTTIL
jgi:hypothetical protein